MSPDKILHTIVHKICNLCLAAFAYFGSVEEKNPCVTFCNMDDVIFLAVETITALSKWGLLRFCIFSVFSIISLFKFGDIFIKFFAT